MGWPLDCVDCVTLQLLTGMWVDGTAAVTARRALQFYSAAVSFRYKIPSEGQNTDGFTDSIAHIRVTRSTLVSGIPRSSHKEREHLVTHRWLAEGLDAGCEIVGVETSDA